MKKLTLLIIFGLIIQVTALSQSCLPEGITFTNQTQIDDFQVTHPNCNTIEGNVEISGSDITNLNGLDILIDVQGNLVIEENDTLASLSGLNNITSVGGTLRIFQNPLLTSLVGLENVSFIGGNLRVTQNNNLMDLSALINITSIGENLRIFQNQALASLAGLDNVAIVGDNLRISDNDALTSLTSLNKLTAINGELGITENDVLTSLSGLDSIDAGTITELSINNNISLPTCEVQSVCNYLASPSGAIDIHDNATGCNSQEEVELACDGTSISDIDFEHSIKIYPNPAKKEIFITARNGVKISEVTIYNRLGQKVLHEEQFPFSVDVSTLKPGIYIIELASDKLSISKKLIIEK